MSVELSAAAGIEFVSSRVDGVPAFGDLRDSWRAGVPTCFQLAAVLMTPANRASPSEMPAAPPAVSSTRSQAQKGSSRRAMARPRPLVVHRERFQWSTPEFCFSR